MHRYPASTLLFILAAVALAWPQSQLQERPAPPPAVADNLLPYSEPLSPPGVVTRDRAPLTFASEAERSNFLTGSLGVAAAFDDNIQPGYGTQMSDTSYLFAPGIDFGQTRGRWRSLFSYRPGFVVNHRFSERNQSSHNLNADFSYGLSPHVTIRLRDRFEKTTSLFSGFSGANSPGFGSLPGANTSILTPLVERTGNTSGLDLAYQFSRDSMVGAGATYYFVNYGTPYTNTEGSAFLIDSRSLSADGFYAHRLANRNWLGVTYGFQRLNFDGGSRTDVQRVLLFYSLPIRAHMDLSFWAGPERHVTYFGGTSPVTTGRESRWSNAAGAEFGWQGQRASLRAAYTRGISDGGGLTQSVRLQQGSAEARYKLAARWTGSVGVGYAVNDPLSSALLQVTKIQVLSANAGLGYQITNNLVLGMQYGRDRQEYPDAVPAIGVANRNRAMVSLSYSFTRPLGR
jgi:hypothetical protein